MASSPASSPEEKAFTAADHLCAQKALRESFKAVPRPTDLLKGDLANTLGEDTIAIAAAACDAIYDSDNSSTFKETIARKLHWGCVKSSADVPYVSARLHSSPYWYQSFGVCECHVPHEDNTEEIDLFLVWEGSKGALDWLTNMDYRPTPTNYHGVSAHGGMFAYFRNFEDQIQKEIDRVVQQPAVQIRNVILCGHSLGGGVAQIAHFQWLTASADHHWPRTEAMRGLRSNAFVVAFAAPSVFFVEDSTATDRLLLGQFAQQGINLVMQFDVVPLIMNKQFVEGALWSVVRQETDQITPLIRSTVRRIWKRLNRWMTADDNVILSKALHLSQLYVRHGDTISTPSSWIWTVRKTTEERQDFQKQQWMFRELSTNLPLDDHLTLPGQILTDWRTDGCCHAVTTLAEGCVDLKPEAVVDEWEDCQQCCMTYCKVCFRNVHKRSARRGAGSNRRDCHTSVKRDVNEKVGQVVQLKLEQLADDALNAYLNRELHWFTLLAKVGADFKRPMNMFLVFDALKDEGVAVISNGWSVPPTMSLSLSPLDGVIVSAIFVADCAWLCYKRWGTKEIDCLEFWLGVSCATGRLIGSLTGMAASMWLGGAIGSLFGPIGTVIGGLVGEAVGVAVGSFGGCFGAKRLFERLAGMDPHQRERVTWAMICQAMIRIGLDEHVTPRSVKLNQVKRAYWQRSLAVHPDKIRSAAEEEQKKCTDTMQKLNHDRALLVCFIDERDRSGTSWQNSALDSMEEMHKEMWARNKQAQDEIYENIAFRAPPCSSLTRRMPRIAAA